ncbi:MAG: molybdopterin-binding protein [Sulfurimonas sp.]|jgi:molybdopterin-binding protein|uniref:TOBE domain-containing protein n=1 Tax=Sulfurimonas sp. TaxID=2022749 RepID=UPI0039E54327
MNHIEATVTDIKKTDIITYIDVECGETTLRLIKSKAPIWLSEGDKVNCDFQEVSVCVSKECPGRVSIENRLSATLKDVRKSESLCELTFDSSLGKVISLITTDAYENLGLELECKATILLRGIDIKISPVIESVFSETRTKYAN